MTGRPYTSELAESICNRIADGESLRTICDEPDMPSRMSFLRWVEADHDGLRDQYARARERQADAYAERIVDTAERATDAGLGRLRMDALKWAASKLAPKRYGERVTQEHVGGGGGPVQIARIERVIVRPQDTNG